MGASISEVAKQFGMTTHAIRYYDKLGLLAEVKRDKGGKRCFTQDDIDRLSIIRCLKNTGMTITDIQEFMDLNCHKDHGIAEKKQMIIKQKAILQDKVNQLNEYIHQSDFKIWFFENKLENGVEPPYSDESFEQWMNEFEAYSKNK